MLSERHVSKNLELLEDVSRLMEKQQVLVNMAYDQIHSGRTMPAAVSSKPKKPIPAGVQAYVWKQDPAVTRIGIRKVFLPHDVVTGPKDDTVEVVLKLSEKDQDQLATGLVVPSNGNFLIDFEKDPFAFDMVNCFAVVRSVVSMYQRDLQINEWKWLWDRASAPGQPKTPLRIICHAGEKPNAAYIRGKRALKFYYITEPTGERTFLCRSLDIVAHEAGHAVL
eukprot:PhM_4_TR11613/c0_g1_i1/m.9889